MTVCIVAERSVNKHFSCAMMVNEMTNYKASDDVEEEAFDAQREFLWGRFMAFFVLISFCLFDDKFDVFDV